MNKIDFQEYLDIIPQVELPLKFDCDAGFEVPEIDSEKNELILKKFKPEGATIIGKLYSNKKESAILYGYPADIFYPIISETDNTGK